MDRCAVLVDAGYLFAEGGKLCCGTPARGRSALRPFLAVELLQKVALETTQLPVLRTYWYDGARDGIRTQEQREVAGLPNVKLRLGRLNASNKQKGVDALIYRDLITLAQHRAISDAVLLSGDEDLREGVRAAQDYGVRVVLVGIACADGNGHNQSEELVLDADHLAVLSKPQLETDVHVSFSCRDWTHSTPSGQGTGQVGGRNLGLRGRRRLRARVAACGNRGRNRGPERQASAYPTSRGYRTPHVCGENAGAIAEGR